MDKLKMAHEMACTLMASNDGYTIGGAVACAWEYVDAMQAEADEREPKGFPDVLLTKKPNGECAHIHTTLNRTECFDCGEVLTPSNSVDLDWHPDWSQAPEWATHFFCERGDDDRLNGYFAEDKKGISIDSDLGGFDGYGRVCSCETFNYQGTWRESLRKRP